MILFDSKETRAALQRLQNNTILDSHTVRVRRSSYGQYLEPIIENLEWQHPWYTISSWNDEAELWEATVVSLGLINGYDAAVPGVKIEEDGKEREAVMTDYPAIPLRSFRTPGADGDPLLEFFKAKGVREPKKDNLVVDDFGVTVVEGMEETNNLPRRYLRACDLYLAKARATFKTSLQEVDATGTSGLTVDFSVTYDTSVLDMKSARPRLQVAAKFPAIVKPTLIDRLFGNYQDEAEDRKPVATVFLLSPPDFDGEPNGQWEPYVQYHLFWHLQYSAPNEVPTRPPQPIRLTTGLAGGIGDGIFNQLLSSQNEFSQRISNAINNTTPEGRFYMGS